MSRRVERVLWGLPKGSRDRLDERVLYTQAKSQADIDRVKKMAAAEGWHSFRVQKLDLDAPPDFTRVLNGRRRPVSPRVSPLPRKQWTALLDELEWLTNKLSDPDGRQDSRAGQWKQRANEIRLQLGYAPVKYSNPGSRRKNVRQVTYEQAADKKRKAERGLLNFAGRDAANKLAEESVESYARRKGMIIVENPAQKDYCEACGRNKDLRRHLTLRGDRTLTMCRECRAGIRAYWKEHGKPEANPRCGARNRKPVGQITDRAKRHRANTPECRPAGRRRCAIRTCRTPHRNLVIDHRDGDESNGSKRNLRWLCKSHNTKFGKRDARNGRGVRTRQYNPGARTLGEYVDAAVNHTRGAFDAGGKVIHETPKAKRREFAREIARRKRWRNPSHMIQQISDTAWEVDNGRGTVLRLVQKPWGYEVWSDNARTRAAHGGRGLMGTKTFNTIGEVEKAYKALRGIGQLIGKNPARGTQFKIGDRVRMAGYDLFARQPIPKGATGTVAGIRGWSGGVSPYPDPLKKMVFVDWDQFGEQSTWRTALEKVGRRANGLWSDVKREITRAFKAPVRRAKAKSGRASWDRMARAAKLRALERAGIASHTAETYAATPWRDIPRHMQIVIRAALAGKAARPAAIKRALLHKRNPLGITPRIREAATTTIVSIGQLSPAEKRELDAAVRKGWIAKGKGGPFPAPKTVYAPVGYDFDLERSKAIAEVFRAERTGRAGTRRNPKCQDVRKGLTCIDRMDSTKCNACLRHMSDVSEGGPWLPAPRRRKKRNTRKRVKVKATTTPFKQARALARKVSRKTGRQWQVKGPIGIRINGRRNPSGAAQAADLYRKFHGRDSTKLTEILQRTDVREDLTALGDLVKLKLKDYEIEFKQREGAANNTMLCSDPAGKQLFVIGGDQDLSGLVYDKLGRHGRDKDSVDLGELHFIEYFTRKGFDNYQPVTYYHKLGEETGVRPRLMYDQRNRQLHIVGGEYQVTPDGIKN